MRENEKLRLNTDQEEKIGKLGVRIANKMWDDFLKKVPTFNPKRYFELEKEVSEQRELIAKFIREYDENSKVEKLKT